MRPIARLAGAAARVVCAAVPTHVGWLAITAPVLLAAAVGGAAAHWLTADDVMRELREPATRESFDVIRIERHPDLERLLVIRVGPGWQRVAAAARREAAESWLARWRHAVPQGIVAVLDAATDRSLVNFEPGGRATLTD